MRYVTDQNQNDWVARFAELKLDVEWVRIPGHPVVKVNGIDFTFKALNAHPDAAEALWNGHVSLALQLVSSRT